MATVPEFARGNAGLEAVHEMILDLVQGRERDLGASLAISTGIRTHGVVFFPGKLAARTGHDFENGFAAGATWGLHLIEKAPENHFERKEAFAAVFPGGPGSQKSCRIGGPEEFAKLG
jgi:hypothetical protein